MSDEKHLTTIDELLAVVLERSTGGRSITAVAGPPGAGKSTVAEALADQLNARTSGSAAVLPMDGYHYDDWVLNERGWRARKGAPHTFDVAGFTHMLARLRGNDELEVAVPVFDRSIEIARAGARIIPRSVVHLVVEGNYLLLDAAPWTRLADYFDTKIFIDVAEDEIRRRLRERWSDLSGRQLEEKVEGNDMPNVRLVQSQRCAADFVFRPQP